MVIFPNGRTWGTSQTAQATIGKIPGDLRGYTALAPEPQADPSMTKYLLDKSDVAVTVEGGMMHLAYNMGKPFVLLQMPGSGEIDWWLAHAISYQKVRFISDRKSLGGLALETLSAHGVRLPSPHGKEPVGEDNLHLSAA